VDVSADMVAAAAAALGGSGRVFAQHLHELHLERLYRTAYMCGVFGLGGRRDHDLEALRRIHRQLAPGGALLITHWLPYGEADETGWLDWLPGRHSSYPPEWPVEGNRKRAADGDEIELLTRTEAFDPLAQQVVLGMRARLWHEGAIVKEELYTLRSCLYFAQEIAQMLGVAGFRDVTIEAGFRSTAATADDPIVTFVARR
jgi:SAM-dependent methyltransferase